MASQQLVAASAASAAAWRRDAEDAGFPAAGAILLLALLAIAVWARRARGVRQGQRPFTWPGLQKLMPQRTAAAIATGLRVEGRVRLNAHTELHQVVWAGGRMLVATSATAAPVIVDRTDAAPTGSGDAEVVP